MATRVDLQRAISHDFLLAIDTRSDAGLAYVITRMENQFGALRADLGRLASTLATRDDLIIKLATLARMNPGRAV